jgi:hypothetical protein
MNEIILTIKPYIAGRSKPVEGKGVRHNRLRLGRARGTMTQLQRVQMNRAERAEEAQPFMGWKPGAPIYLH